MTKREKKLHQMLADLDLSQKSNIDDAINHISEQLKNIEREIFTGLAKAPKDYEIIVHANLLEQIQKIFLKLDHEKWTKGHVMFASDLGEKAGNAPLDSLIKYDNTLRIPLENKDLVAIASFFHHRVDGIYGDLKRKIETELGLVLLGAQGKDHAVSAIQKHTNMGGYEVRRLVTTELNRAFSIRQFQQLKNTQEFLPHQQKQWKHSGLRTARTPHVVADGQIKDINEPFLVNGYHLRFPHDPQAPASETINCRCAMLPFLDDWEISVPGRSESSIELHPEIRHELGKEIGVLSKLAQDRSAQVEYAQKTSFNFIKKFETIGFIPQHVASKIPQLQSRSINLSFERIRHMVREKKHRAFSDDVIKNLPSKIHQAKEFYYDKNKNSLNIILGQNNENTASPVLFVHLAKKDKLTGFLKGNNIATGHYRNKDTIQNLGVLL